MRRHIEIGPVLLEAIEEWSQFFHPCNWRTFHPVHVEWKDDIMLGAFEVQVIVLGLGFRVRWNHTETETKREIIESAEEVKRQLDEEDRT